MSDDHHGLPTPRSTLRDKQALDVLVWWRIDLASRTNRW